MKCLIKISVASNQNQNSHLRINEYERRRDYLSLKMITQALNYSKDDD